MYKLLKAFTLTICFTGLAMSQVSDEEFILENMELLETLEILESDVSIEQLETITEEERSEQQHES